MTDAATPRPHDNRVVHLPLYDKETGETLPGYLQMNIGFFLEQSSRLRHDFKVVEFKDPTPAQEIEIIDRIISGLPMEYVTPANPDGNAIYAKAPEGVTLYDVNSLYPKEFRLTEERKSDELIKAANTWRRIPDFDNYEVNPLGVIRNRWTRRVMEVTEDGEQKYVAMHDKDGFDHAVNINFVMEKVYGK